ncbi:hypothetical protein NN6n1_00200 [Shinella zoogloeoides]
MKLWPFLDRSFTDAFRQNALPLSLGGLMVRMSRLRADTFPMSGTALAHQGLNSFAAPGETAWEINCGHS